MATFALYTDSGLTTGFSGVLSVFQNVDGSTGPVDTQLWLGSTAVGKTLQAESDPGVDQITITPTDAAPGTGHPASEIKLALTQGGLAAATGGAALNLGTAITSGVGNAVTFWIRVQDSTLTAGVSTELSFPTNLLIET